MWVGDSWCRDLKVGDKVLNWFCLEKEVSVIYYGSLVWELEWCDCICGKV